MTGALSATQKKNLRAIHKIVDRRAKNRVTTRCLILQRQGALVKIWKAGDLVQITYRQQTIVGRVILASSNGRSLMLEFEGMLGGFVGRMPVLQADNNGPFQDLIDGEVAELREVALS